MKKYSVSLTALILLLIPLAAFAEVFYVDTDNVGSPVAMWDNQGTKVWEAEYLPFGEEYTTTKSPQDNKNRFVGKEKDKETGLTYFGARYFDEKSGRFLTPDPVRLVDPFTSKTNYEMLKDPQRLNRYAYGLNNPYRYVDPDGNMAKDLDPSNDFDEILEGGGARGGGYGGYTGPSFRFRDFFKKPTDKIGDSSKTTSNSARREVMRQQDIPTSQQPISQSSNMSGRSYEYEVPKPGGGTQIKSVQQQTMDQSHPGQGHWEAGSVKTDPISGQVRSNQYGRPKLTNDKSKVNYDE